MNVSSFYEPGDHLIRFDDKYECFVFVDHDYDIPAKDMKSLYWMAEWFAHLSEKTWVTKDHLRALAKAVQRYNKGVCND